MKPAFYATTCSNHSKKKTLTCGCSLYCINRRIYLYTEKQVKGLLSENKKLRKLLREIKEEPLAAMKISSTLKRL